MQELITVQTTPAAFECNFEELRDQLERELREYRGVVVTEDTIKQGKDLVAELRQTRKVIDQARKDEVAKASEPVKRFDANMKELVGMVDEGVTEIQDQVKRFEDELRAEIQEKLEEVREELWNDYSIAEEFRRAQVQDLAILSNFTKKENLTAKARDSVKARVESDRSLQDQTRLRLSELEAESYRRGLASPLTRDHVEHFLFADDEKYQRELDRILTAELDRQAKAEQRERERQESQGKARQKAEQESDRRQAVAQENQAKASGSAEPVTQSGATGTETQAAGTAQSQSEPAKPGTVSVTVTATFEIQVPDNVTDQGIEQKLRRQLRDAGFLTSPRIAINRGNQ